MVELIIDRVAQKHIPQQRPDGSFHPGVMDANMENTDQVPVYIEDRSKGTWGMREYHTPQVPLLWSSIYTGTWSVFPIFASITPG